MRVPKVSYILENMPALRPGPPMPAVSYIKAGGLDPHQEHTWYVEDFKTWTVEQLDDPPPRPGRRTTPSDRIKVERTDNGLLHIGGYLTNASPECCLYNRPSECYCEYWTLAEIPIHSPSMARASGFIHCNAEHVRDYAQWTAHAIAHERTVQLWNECQHIFSGLPSAIQKWWNQLSLDKLDDRGVPLRLARSGAWCEEFPGVSVSDWDEGDPPYLLDVRVDRLGDTEDHVSYGFADRGGQWNTAGSVTVEYLG